jgi:membrane protein insertase Oxa1/YidC/SpoIIIJ
MLFAMVVVARIMAASGPQPGGNKGLGYAFPVAMTMLFYPCPSGCMLFWTTGNLLQIAEQKLATARARAA